MFLAWYDGDKKRFVDTKIDDAIDHYEKKFGKSPECLLLNPTDLKLLEERFPTERPIYRFHGVYLRAEWFVPKNVYYVGEEDDGGV